jgi:hypothetical protein
VTRLAPSPPVLCTSRQLTFYGAASARRDGPQVPLNVPVARGSLPSATATWEDLVVLDGTVRARDYPPPQTAAAVRPVTVTTRQGDRAVTVSATARGDGLFHSADPWWHMAWRTGQRKRPGGEWLVSTGRHHAYESQQERRPLQALAFDGRAPRGRAGERQAVTCPPPPRRAGRCARLCRPVHVRAARTRRPGPPPSRSPRATPSGSSPWR